MFAVAIALMATSWMNQTGSPAEKALEPVQTIEVTAARDVSAIRALDDALHALSDKVTSCVTAGKPAASCRCAYPDLLSKLRKGYDAFIADHPAWKDGSLSYRYVNNEGQNLSGLLVLRNLRRQLEAIKCE